MESTESYWEEWEQRKMETNREKQRKIDGQIDNIKCTHTTQMVFKKRDQS